MRNRSRLNSWMSLDVLLFLFVVLFAAMPAWGAVFVGTDSYQSTYITGASQSTVTAPLVHGALAMTVDAAWAGKIVLVDRGTNTYLDKINNVKQAGGLAVIIANSGGNGIFAGTLGTGNASTITGVNISRADGDKLFAKVGSMVHIGPTAPPVPAGPQVPSPIDRKDELLASDGQRLIYVKVQPGLVVIEMASTAQVGQAVSFKATAQSAVPITYQWKKDSVDIAGATNELFVLPSVQLTDAGKFQCVVTNSGGSSSSQIYTLSVNP